MKQAVVPIRVLILLVISAILPNTSYADCTAVAPNNECSPGGGSAKTDCMLEWRFTPMPVRLVNATPTPDVFHERARNRIICYEGDPRCDFDANLTNYSCTFRTDIIANNADPNLPKCTPGVGIATFEVMRPKDSPFSIGSTDLINLDTLETRVSEDFGVPVLRNGALLINGSTNSTLNQEGMPIDLIVPQGVTSRGSHTTGTRRIRIRSTSPLGKSDQDALLLVCRPSTCGNGIIEPDHELCDDGNRINNDGCNQGCQTAAIVAATATATLTETFTPAATATQTNTSPPGTPTNTPTITETPGISPTPTITSTPAGPPTAFRGGTLAIVDPHVFVSPAVGTCNDGTSLVNSIITQALTQDQDDPADGLLDLSVLLVFRPLQQAAAGGNVDLQFGADCTAPPSGTSCTPGGATIQIENYTNQSSGTCLAGLAGTTGGFSPPVNTTNAPCFVSDELNITFDISGISIPLQAGRFAATYTGGPPATSLTTGLIRGFLAETDAENVFLPADVPAPFGGVQLSTLLAGGENNCRTVPPRGPCTAFCRDDRDMGPGGVVGWYFYLNFTGPKVTYSE